MTRILFINMYQGSALRGAETFVENVSNNLKKSFEVDLISGDSKPFPRWPFLWRFFLDPHGLAILFFTLGIIPTLLKKKYDIIIPVNGGWMPLIIRLVTWIIGGKVIISGQSGVGWDERINLFTFPNAFIGLSQKAKDWASRVNPLVQSFYIPNGVDTSKFKIEGKKVETKLKPPIILCQGALTKEKRIDLTIKAVSKIKNASLMVVGYKGDAYIELSELGKKLLGDRFEIRSFPRDTMPEVYRRADAFTLVSKPYFSFEIAIVEAMSAGIPVVVNDDPIRRSIVGSNGFFVDPTDIAGYSEALKKALSVGKSKNYRNSVAGYDWKIISKRYEEVINKILK